MAQPKAVRSVPDKALLAGLLDSEPVLWFELEPMGNFSDPWLGVDDVLGLSPEAWDEPVEGLVSVPEPEVEVDVPEPVRAVSRPPDVPLEPEPASPESLPLELPVPEPAKPESLPFEPPVPEPASPKPAPLEPVPLEPVLPEPAKPVSLPLEFPAPEPARPFPPALELGAPGLGFDSPPPAVLEPVAPEVVGLVPVPEVLLGRFEGVLRPLPVLELGVVVPVWLGREDSAPETGLTGAPEGLESKLEVGC
jgi:hypothetical protein